MTFLLALLYTGALVGLVLLVGLAASWWATVIVATHEPKPRKRMEPRGPYR